MVATYANILDYMAGFPPNEVKVSVLRLADLESRAERLAEVERENAELRRKLDELGRTAP